MIHTFQTDGSIDLDSLGPRLFMTSYEDPDIYAFVRIDQDEFTKVRADGLIIAFAYRSVEQVTPAIRTITNHDITSVTTKVEWWGFHLGVPIDIDSIQGRRIDEDVCMVGDATVQATGYVTVSRNFHGSVEQQRCDANDYFDTHVYGVHPTIDREWHKRYRVPRYAPLCLAIREKVDDLVLRRVFENLV